MSAAISHLLKGKEKHGLLSTGYRSKSNLTDKIKWDFFQAVSVFVWMHQLESSETHGEKARGKLHENSPNCLNKSWKQHPIKQQLCGYLPSISKTIRIRTRHARYCWWSKDELLIKVLLWTLTHEPACILPTSEDSYASTLCGH